LHGRDATFHVPQSQPGQGTYLLDAYGPPNDKPQVRKAKWMHQVAPKRVQGKLTV